MGKKPFICQGCMTELPSGNTPHNYYDCLEAKNTKLEDENEGLRLDRNLYDKGWDKVLAENKVLWAILKDCGIAEVVMLEG